MKNSGIKIFPLTSRNKKINIINGMSNNNHDYVQINNFINSITNYYKTNDYNSLSSNLNKYSAITQTNNSKLKTKKSRNVIKLRKNINKMILPLDKSNDDLRVNSEGQNNENNYMLNLCRTKNSNESYKKKILLNYSTNCKINMDENKLFKNKKNRKEKTVKSGEKSMEEKNHVIKNKRNNNKDKIKCIFKRNK